MIDIFLSTNKVYCHSKGCHLPHTDEFVVVNDGILRWCCCDCLFYASLVVSNSKVLLWLSILCFTGGFKQQISVQYC